MSLALQTLRTWGARHWLVALASAAATFLFIAVPTAMIDTPVFGRDIPTPAWAWPALAVSSVLAGLVVATYVRTPTASDAPDDDSAASGGDDVAAQRRGLIGGLLTFFAVGCPVCNKLVLLALGYSGAMTWFEPMQPVLQVIAVALLGWAVWARLRYAAACPVRPAAATGETPLTGDPQPSTTDRTRPPAKTHD